MKTRQGFVSNSSSSSFIIGFKTKPKSVEEVKKIFFGKKEDITNECYYESGNNEPTFSTWEMAERIFSDLKNAKPIKESKVVEEISSGWFPDFPGKIWGYRSEAPSWKYEREYKLKTGKDIRSDDKSKEYKEWVRLMNEEWKERSKKIDEAAEKYWDKVSKKFIGKKFYVLSYSDNDGDFNATLEHGGILEDVKGVPCIRVSHH